MTLKARLMLLVVLAVCGLSLALGFSLSTLRALQVNGPLYKQIAQGKDLVADVLPPPEFVVESYLLVQRIVNEPSPEKRAALVGDLEAAERSFETQRAFWEKELPDGQLKALVTGDSYDAARQFYDVVRSGVLPALQSRDAGRLRAAQQAAEAAFEKHRAVVLQIVKLATERNAANEDLGRATVQSRTAWLVGLILLLVLVTGWVAVSVARRVVREVAALASESRRLEQAVQDGKLAERADPNAVSREFRGVVTGMNSTMDAFVRPLEAIASCLKDISHAEIPPRIAEQYRGDFGKIQGDLNGCIDAVGALVRDANALAVAAAAGDLSVRADASKHPGSYRQIVQGMNATMDAVNALVVDARRLAGAALEGKLAVRADASKHQGEFRNVVQGMNDTLDAVVGPLGTTAEYVQRISRGDIPPRITREYPGDFRLLRDNVNTCIDALSGLLAEMGRVSAAHDAGDIDAAVDGAKFQGAYRSMAQGINDMVGGHIAMNRKAMGVVGEFGKGNFEAPLEQFPGKKRFINDTIEQVRASMKGLIAEMNRMSREHEAGEIDVAIDTARFQGDFGAMAKGINAMVGDHIAMNRKAMAVVGEFGKGNFEAPLEQLPGKKRFVNDTIEQVRGNLKSIIAEMDRMSREHEAGDIDVAIEASGFQGDFRTIAQGINAMVAGHVAMNRKAMAVVGEFGKGNFEAPLEQLPGKKRFINETVEQVRANLKSLIADTRLLARAAVDGRLDVRVDASRHQGDYRQIVQGVNDTVDALLAPLRDLAAVLDRLAAGDLDARSDPSRYQNESRRIVEGVNGTLDALLAPVEEATGVLRKLADRDLRARMTGAYQGGHATMKLSVNGTAEALNQAMAQVAEAVGQVASASKQIASSSQAVASGASQQAASIEETSASLESISATTKRSADSAQEADGLAHSAKKAASEGTAVMEQMGGAMANIKASAESTSQIIKDINEIAFQTNLLALNAAVEAARAGEAGRGFAVVAEEVRSLALRAKEAANKTEELIRESVKQAGEGEQMSKEASHKLDEIADGISKVSAVVGEIAAAAKEQALGIAQVNRAVAEMDKVVQQNAASSEESSSAAQELTSQAEHLATTVGRFQLERAAAATGRPPALRAV